MEVTMGRRGTDSPGVAPANLLVGASRPASHGAHRRWLPVSRSGTLRLPRTSRAVWRTCAHSRRRPSPRRSPSSPRTVTARAPRHSPISVPPARRGPAWIRWEGH